MLAKSVGEYNDSQLELNIEYSVAYTNSTEEKVYDVRKLIGQTNRTINM